ncbi:hypothetical protein CHS0354_007631 [Potamilus streckersoni]|uniref:DUF5577 domain-containing protein n=1 Tax=Potamilus streckersoni TaxID=2493646 RepID=A0AAE0VWI0_9BIVA|nr:hypothetical protein CHS0354_007631 [Potamilus streckersoni]
MASPSTSDMSYWIKFFKDAGIPAGDAANYAVIFSDNRISSDMLMDLNKDYLNDMDITILGDVISILKHAKSVYTQESRDKALRNVSSTKSPTPKKTTAASRIVGRIIGSDPAASPLNEPLGPKISRELSARLGISKTEEKTSTVVHLSTMPRIEVPVPKKRRVLPEYEGPYKITLPTGTTAKTKKLQEQKRKQDGTKTSVFDRLGLETQSSEPTITVTGLSKVSVASATSVFSRLGKTSIKRAATSTVMLDDDDIDDEFDDKKDDRPLEYAGVLKNATRLAKLSAAKKARKVLIEKKKKELEESPSSFHTHGVLAPHAKIEPVNVKARLGHKVDNKPSADSSSSSLTVTFNQEQKGVKSRLGPQKSLPGNTPDSKGVFRRLGKQT